MLGEWWNDDLILDGTVDCHLMQKKSLATTSSSKEAAENRNQHNGKQETLLHTGVAIMDLPSFIIVAILSRLPIRTLLRCRCVCKTWFNLLLDPYFNNVRLARSAFINIVFRVHNSFYLLELGHDHDCNYTHQPHGRMWFKNPLELGHDSKYAHQPMWLPHATFCSTTIEPHRPTCFRKTFCIPHRELELVGSCNGLLCFSDYYQTIDHVYIVNPILGEYVTLPKPEYKVICVAYGLDLDVVRAQTSIRSLIISKTVEVCTLTSGTWRKLGDAPFQLLVNQCGVTLNGAVHWIVPCSECIYSFDIEDEQFHPIPLPPKFENGKCYVRLGVLGNCLSVFDNSWHHLDMWSMKDCGVATSWTKDCILKNTIPSGLDNGSLPNHNLERWRDLDVM